KVTYMKLAGVRFIDSCRFLPMPLSKLPAAFGFEGDQQKGDFPHLFNTKANWTYVGQIPDLHFYDPDSKSEKGAKKLVDWWQEKRAENYVFDFRAEIRNQQVSYNSNMAMTSMVTALLSYGSDARESHLTLTGYDRDTSGHMNDTTGNTNPALGRR